MLSKIPKDIHKYIETFCDFDSYVYLCMSYDAKPDIQKIPDINEICASNENVMIVAYLCRHINYDMNKLNNAAIYAFEKGKLQILTWLFKHYRLAKFNEYKSIYDLLLGYEKYHCTHALSSLSLSYHIPQSAIFHMSCVNKVNPLVEFTKDALYDRIVKIEYIQLNRRLSRRYWLPISDNSLATKFFVDVKHDSIFMNTKFGISYPISFIGGCMIGSVLAKLFKI